jgi:cobalt-zinc-cadmium efflux system outer membrane protein
MLVHRSLPIGLLILLAATALPAGAAESAPAPGTRLTLNRAVDLAYARAPATATIAGLRQQAQALRRRSQAWLGGAPSVYGSYRSDQPYNDTGTVEGELGLELPLPNWGQRRAARALADVSATVAPAQARALRLEVAGLVRESFWALRLADNRRQFAQENVDAAEQLYRSVQKRVQKGDLARADLLLAHADLLKKQGELSQARAARRQALSVWRGLTGTDRLPVDTRERAAPGTAISPQHPLLLAARTRVQQETANLRYVRAQGAANPTLTLGIRHERPDRLQAYANSALVTLSVPFTMGRYAAPAIAEAGLARAHAQTAYDRTRRELILALRQARAQLKSDRQQLQLARQQARLAKDYLAMNRKAFAAGEIDLFTLLRIQSDTQTARLDNAQRAIVLRRDTARYNQALGVLP